MKTIKILTALVCMFSIITVQAQTTEKTEQKVQVKKKTLQGKKPVNVPKATAVKETKDESLQTDPPKGTVVRKDDKKTNSVPAEKKNDKPADKQKMKQINRPVKSTPK